MVWNSRRIDFTCTSDADAHTKEDALCAHLANSDGHEGVDACIAALKQEQEEEGVTISQNFCAFVAGISQPSVC